MTKLRFEGLVQDCSISSTLAMEILQSCSKPSSWSSLDSGSLLAGSIQISYSYKWLWIRFRWSSDLLKIAHGPRSLVKYRGTLRNIIITHIHKFHEACWPGSRGQWPGNVLALEPCPDHERWLPCDLNMNLLHDWSCKVVQPRPTQYFAAHLSPCAVGNGVESFVMPAVSNMFHWNCCWYIAEENQSLILRQSAKSGNGGNS